MHGARVDQRLSAASRVVRGAPCGNRHVGAGHRGARLARRCCCWWLQLGLVAMIDVRPFIYKQTTHPGDADTQAHRQSPAQGRARRRPERRPKLTQRQSEAGSDSRSGVRLCVPVPVCPVSQGCANLGSDRHRGVGSSFGEADGASDEIYELNQSSKNPLESIALRAVGIPNGIPHAHVK